MEITLEQIKTLREKTGAGIMDCKRALMETNGDIEKAIEYLRKKGASVLEKHANRETKQGLIEAYIHAGGRVGAIVEINCETDFVARTDEFKQLAHDIAMQIAAMNPKVVSRDQLSEELVKKEFEIYKEQALAEGKPEDIAEKIAQGKLEKFFEEVCLLDQPFIKDQGKTIKDLIHEAAAKFGENIVIRRFVRYYLGESLDR